MKKEKIANLTLAVLSVFTVLLIIFAIFVVSKNERKIEAPCEDIVKQNNKSNYVPIPKRCMKGE